MEDRMGLNSTESRELKLGSTFSSHHNAFHTLKYDFKPASVDLNKEATVEVGTNNQVQVTVPHLDGSGVPKTVFKGNQKKYTKECVLIIDKNTGEFTLERLSSNVSVKKTRSESVIKGNGQMGVGGVIAGGGNINPSASGPSSSSAAASSKINENSTQRTVSKTRVSTGVRKNNAITGFMPKHSPNQVTHVEYTHKSPQSAPAWNANNGQSTLPSIPMIDDDVEPLGQPQAHNMHQNNQNHHHNHHQQPQHNNSNNHQHHHHNNNVNHHQQQAQPPPPVQAVQPPPIISSGINSVQASTELMSSSDSSDSDSYSSDSDSSHHSAPSSKPTPATATITPNLLKEDLCLSDSNSDSD